MTEVRLDPVDHNYMKVSCDAGILQELFEEFSFFVPGYKFSPKFRKGWWDGKIRLLNKRTRLIYRGLAKAVEEFCAEREYAYENNCTQTGVKITDEQIITLIRNVLKVPESFDIRPYQIETIRTAINDERRLILSPTSSGKSLIQYVISAFFAGKTRKKVLIVVPLINLVKQMEGDFADYGCDPNKIYQIKGGVDKNIPDHVKYVVTTWQSVYQQPIEWFNQFGAVCGDEAHLFTADALGKLMAQTSNISAKFGFTGTLDGSKTNKMVLEGLFGPVFSCITTRELIDQGYAADIKIKICILKHTKENRKANKGADYQTEVDSIITNPHRIEFVSKLALALNGNTLILSSRVEKHGIPLYEFLRARAENVHMIHGGIEGEERERIRQLIEKSNNAKVVASYQTFSTGANIKNLPYGILALGSKGRIRNLQSIGRGLRLHSDKEEFTLFDIADDLSNGKKQNHTLKHLLEYRIPQYDEQQFAYETREFELKG